MIDIAARIKTAATDETLRAAASAIWARQAPALFEPHPPREGLRVSDAGQCVRALWNEVHGVTKKSFDPEVQLFNLDEGTLTGAWMACLLAANLEADGCYVELEPTVDHDGTPGHIDLFYVVDPNHHEGGVVEFKKTFWTGAPGDPTKDKRYQCLQLMKYCAAKRCEDGALVTVAPASRGPKLNVTWLKLSEWQEAIRGEWMRLSAALGPVEPQEDAKEAFRCRGCPVTNCTRNPGFQLDVESQLRASLP